MNKKRKVDPIDLTNIKDHNFSELIDMIDCFKRDIIELKRRNTKIQLLQENNIKSYKSMIYDLAQTKNNAKYSRFIALLFAIKGVYFTTNVNRLVIVNIFHKIYTTFMALNN